MTDNQNAGQEQERSSLSDIMKDLFRGSPLDNIINSLGIFDTPGLGNVDANITDDFTVEEFDQDELQEVELKAGRAEFTGKAISNRGRKIKRKVDIRTRRKPFGQQILETINGQDDDVEDSFEDDFE